MKCPKCNATTDEKKHDFCKKCGFNLILYLYAKKKQEMERKGLIQEKEGEGVLEYLSRGVGEIYDKHKDKVLGEMAEFIGESATFLLGVDHLKTVCQNCKNIIDKKAKFCSHCGAKFNEKETLQMKQCRTCGTFYDQSNQFCPKCKR
tara:strand:- start:1494 stop:1934 length:441 start_codon:yes stop_codon:yes gene_type:complete